MSFETEIVRQIKTENFTVTVCTVAGLYIIDLARGSWVIDQDSYPIELYDYRDCVVMFLQRTRERINSIKEIELRVNG